MTPVDVRFGSKADMTLLNFDVRFTPKSGHSPTRSGCLLWAISGLMQCSKTRHSITSSARSSMDVGSAMPSALAVCRLTMTLNLVVRSTGRSPGFAPLRILSIKAAAR